MGEMDHVTDGPGLLVTIVHIKRSEFWGLANRLWSAQEDRDDILGSWVTDEKADFLDAVNREETAWDDDVNAKTMAKKVIVNMVGKRMLMQAQLDRLRYDEAEYTRTMDRVEAYIEKETKNLMVQKSPVRVVSVQPQMLDPDSDYPNDIS
jgi:hypothetical protein